MRALSKHYRCALVEWEPYYWGFKSHLWNIVQTYGFVIFKFFDYFFNFWKASKSNIRSRMFFFSDMLGYLGHDGSTRRQSQQSACEIFRNSWQELQLSLQLRLRGHLDLSEEVSERIFWSWLSVYSGGCYLSLDFCTKLVLFTRSSSVLHHWCARQ